MERREPSRFRSTIPDCRNYPYQEDPERVLAREKTRAAILKENNTVCPICRKGMLHTVHCPKQKKAVCEEHCLICGYHRRPTPANNGTCLYTKKGTCWNRRLRGQELFKIFYM